MFSFDHREANGSHTKLFRANLKGETKYVDG